jgi:hypothetical protein
VPSSVWGSTTPNPAHWIRVRSLWRAEACGHESQHNGGTTGEPLYREPSAPHLPFSEREGRFAAGLQRLMRHAQQLAEVSGAISSTAVTLYQGR